MVGISTTHTEERSPNTKKYSILFSSDFLRNNKEYDNDYYVEYGSMKLILTLTAQNLPYTLTEI